MREVALAVTLFAFVLSGCTIRYSQAVVGRVALVKPSAISNSDGGLELGLVPPQAGVLVFSEPIPAHEMAKGVPCESGLAQVDYRGMFFAFYVTANFPEVELRSYCAQ